MATASSSASPFEYFATLPADQLADAMKDKIRVWREWCASRGLTALWQKKLANYYGISAGGNSSQAINQGGSEGELALIKVNDLHSLVQTQLILVTGQRPAGIARAINADTKALKASRIGTAVSEYYMATVGWEQLFINQCEIALLCDEAYCDYFWDKMLGKAVAADPQSGETFHQGDVVMRLHTSWNTTRDPGLTVPQQKWHIFSYRGNKFDFAASYPKFKERILACEDDGIPELSLNDIPDKSDAIYAHLLVHDRTAACPKGRYALLIGDDVVYDDQAGLPYKSYPVERMTAADVIDGCTGYAAANDIMALEEVTDALNSIATTNLVNFGGQCIVGPQGADLKVSDLAKGVRYFELPPDMVGMLHPLELCATPPELYNYLQTLGMKKEQAVGSNSVVRGQPEGQLAGASGAALALIQTQAISFNSGAQRSYFRLLSGGMTKGIEILAQHGDGQRVATIAGKSKSAGLKEFKYTGSDLDQISSIVYEVVNPISQTFGGRLTMAQDLLKAGQCKSPKEYINLVATGQPDVLTEDDEADGLLILEENEWLMEGKPVHAIITQNHQDHIKSHVSQITLDVQATDEKFVTRILDHVQEHIDIWNQASQQNPGILFATGQQPLPQPASFVPPGGAPGVPNGAPPLPPKPPQGIGKLEGGGIPPAEQRAAQIKQPNLPNVAGTKEKPIIPGVSAAGVA
jgi:hypothetical protein